MNPFSANRKSSQSRINQRTKIKSKYFGQYEPQVFIAIRSKSKSRSTSKDDINNLIAKKSPQNNQVIKIDSQQLTHKAQTITINPQISKPSISINSGGLSEYFLARNASPRRRKQGSAIQMIIEWVERRYYEKIKNQKIDKDTFLSFLRDKSAQISQNQKFQESLKKFAYDAFILSRVKRRKQIKIDSLDKGKQSLIVYNQSPKYESKENDIDNMKISPVNQMSKAEDFDIYKFKKNTNYCSDVNLIRISQLSIDNINRSGHKIASNQYLPEKEQFSSCKHKFEIPTMNTFQNIEDKDCKLQSQKYFQLSKNQRQNNAFFVQTVRSTDTNQMTKYSKNSIPQNSQTGTEKLITGKELPKTEPLHKGDFKINIQITKVQGIIKVKENQQQLAKKNLQLRIADNLELFLSKNIINQTGLCLLDYWPNSLFNPQKLPYVLDPIHLNDMNILDERDDQISQIFQMNDHQQNILKAIGLNPNYQLLSSKKYQKNQIMEQSESIINKIQLKNNSQISKSKKSLAENYFSMHLALDQQPYQLKTYQMPMAKAHTNFKVKMIHGNQFSTQNSNKILVKNKSPNKEVFTFNSLSPQNNTRKAQATKEKVSFQNKEGQKKKISKKCNIFGLCSEESAKQPERKNYFTEMAKQERQKGVSGKSNQSKAYSKPKVSFNYLSPSQKNIQMFSKQKEGENSILFKNQASNLKNAGSAPVKIKIIPSGKKKSNEQIMESIVKEVISTQIRQFRPQSNVAQEKERSQSVPHFSMQKVVPSAQKLKMESTMQYENMRFQKKTQTQNVFPSVTYGSQYYYQSKKSIANPTQNQEGSIETNYQSAQSYYFPGMLSSHMGNTQKIAYKGISLGPGNSSKKDKQPITRRNDHRYIYPIQQSVEKQRNQRTKSLCQKIILTVKKNPC